MKRSQAEMYSMKACCVTGHRPKAFPWTKNHKDKRQNELLSRLESTIDEAIELGYKRFITGNALGIDTWAAEIVLAKKECNPDIVLEIAIPFSGHNADVAKIQEVQDKADLVHVVSSARSMRTAYYERNKYMVDHSEAIIAVYDASVSPGGGTANTFARAKKLGKKIFQIKWGDLI